MQRHGNHTCRTWKGTGVDGIDVADKMVMTSGFSSAFSWSDSNGLSREMLHMTSNTPAEQSGKHSVNEVSPARKRNSTPFPIVYTSEVLESFSLFLYINPSPTKVFKVYVEKTPSVTGVTLCMSAEYTSIFLGLPDC